VTPRGDFIVALSGEKAIDGILFGGLCTNTLSPRMNGAVRTPFTKMLGDGHLSFEVAGGDFAARRTVVDNAFLTERQQYLADPFPKWQRVDSLSSMPDRNVYLEFATKTSNPNFPPRVGLGGACSEEQAADPRSWFQISRAIRHQSPAAPQDELSRMQPLFADEAPASIEEVAGRYREVMTQAIKAWRENQTTDDHVRWLQWMLTSGVLKNQFTEQTHAAIFNLVTQYRTLETRLQEPATVNGLVDTDPPMDYRLNVRGDYDQLGDAVPHGSARFLMDVCGEEEQLRDREELAGFVTSPQNPLTSRVYVNRVWHWLFGAGLVTTTDDFGHAGEKPSHPELLDYLARRFMSEGWSTKKLIRLMLLSRTWQQSQDTTARAIELDPSNRLLHHFPVQRLDAESLRDAMLAVSGRLDDTMHGPTANPWRLNEDPQKRLFSGPIDGLGRRSIYTKITIMEPPRFLATFNQPAPKIPTGRRDISTTPAQSLTLLNDPFVAEQAKYWATQLVADADLSAEARLEQMFLKAYGRRATETEITRWMEAVSGFAADQEIPAADVMKSTSVWQTIAHAVFNTKEFLYVR
jgi:hypothetical protein